ncbi:ribonuclease H-like domain-containing protein [Tanacetum coccineum]
MRMKKFYKKTGRKLQFDAKEPVGFDKTKVECYNCHKTGHFARECRIKGTQENSRRDHGNLGNKEKKVLQSVFMNKESDIENQPLYDRFVTAEGMHAVPPPMTGNYMPSGPEIEVDYSQFTYGPKQTQPSESKSQSSEFDTCKVDAPIIEEYESDSEDEYVSIPTKQQETPSFANQQVKTPRETVKNQFTHSQKPKV